MLRTVLGVVAGIATWFVVATALNFGLRVGWPGYAAAEPQMTFDLSMMLARLTESTIALVIAGFVTARVAQGRVAAPWVLGLFMLACFVPVHYMLWAKFPVWYHAYFLASLVVIPLLVANWTRDSGPRDAVV